MKESFEAKDGKPEAKSNILVMDKRKKGYDAANSDWRYAIVGPDGAAQMTGSGKAGQPTNFCAAVRAPLSSRPFIQPKSAAAR